MLVAKKPIMGGNLIWAEIPEHQTRLPVVAPS